MSGRRVPSIYTNSIYSRQSTDSSARPGPEQQRSTYLQYSSNGGHPIRASESANSIYSRASNASQPSASQLASQPVATPQSPPRAAPAPPVPAVPTSNTLLLAIAGPPDPMLKSYVQTALGRASSISEITILGPQTEEQALKQLKVDMYSLAGSMQKEIGVHVSLMQGWSAAEMRGGFSEVLGLEKKANGVGAIAEKWGGSGGAEKAKALRGVILDMSVPTSGAAREDEGMVDLLDVDTADLEEGWRRSVGYLHAFAREAVPLLRLAAHHEQGQERAPGTGLQNPFFIMTMRSKASSNGSINETTLRSLLDSLSRTTGNRGLTFGHADQLLIPDPEPVLEPGRPVVAPTDGWNDTGSPAGESPTKLWGMWSMQNELSNYD